MSENNDDNKTLEMEAIVRDASSASAPAKPRKAPVKRSPRKKTKDSDVVVFEASDEPKKVTRVPRKRKVAETSEIASAELVASTAPVKRSRPVAELSDEVVGAPAISIPRRVPEKDVPSSYSSDSDDSPPPAKVAPSPDAARDEADRADESGPGRKALERRRERRSERFSSPRGEEDNYPRDDSSRDERQDDSRNQAPRDERGGSDDRDERRDGDRNDDRNGNRNERGGDDRDERRSTDRNDERDEGRSNDRGDNRNDRDDRRGGDRSNERDERDEGRGDDRNDNRNERSGGADRDNSERSDESNRTDRQQGREPSRQNDDRHRYEQRGGSQHGNSQQGGSSNQQGGNSYNDRRLGRKQKFKQNKRSGQQGGGQNAGKSGGQSQPRQAYGNQQQRRPAPRTEYFGKEESVYIEIGDLPEIEQLRDVELMERLATEHQGGGEPVDLCELLTMSLHLLLSRARDEFNVPVEGMPIRAQIVDRILNAAWEANRAIVTEGIVETTSDGFGLLVYQHDNYRIRPLCSFVPRVTMRRFGLKRGHIVKAQIQPPRKELTMDGNKENCPAVLLVESVMGTTPMDNLQVTPFEDLIPYYPTERFLLETKPDVKWDNVSMRVVDLLTPVGKGQRGLIVAPPRTGKTILQQGIANAVMMNNPEAHLIVLLVDERPEEVTDFRRQITRGEVISSTFDEAPESHVHAAEMVIEKARRMVEVGRHVVILLDSITRLGRAYNALAANSGKILSGGVEATALQKPKRFFGSARNIEGGGSLTILGTALVETGSRMDEVIFEEFKGTGNMELVLDRAMVEKRIFPSINLEKSGTRKEELLYHPDELIKVYGLRRAMKGVPSPDAMEMLITRVKKTKTNIEFLIGLNR